MKHDTTFDFTLSLVADWHEKFGLPIAEDPTFERGQLRVDLIQEELDELKDAIEAGDIKLVLDALSDIQIVLDGTYLDFGLHRLKHAGVREAHDANMSKVDENGNPKYRDDGKVMKTEFYRPPNFWAVLRDHFGEALIPISRRLKDDAKPIRKECTMCNPL